MKITQADSDYIPADIFGTAPGTAEAERKKNILAGKSNSRTRYRTRYRCNSTKKCGYRFAVRSKNNQPTCCPVCGGNIGCVEGQRLRELAKQTQCNCMAYPFPHQSGSLRMCAEHKDKSEPSAADVDDYKRVLQTPRTGTT